MSSLLLARRWDPPRGYPDPAAGADAHAALAVDVGAPPLPARDEQEALHPLDDFEAELLVPASLLCQVVNITSPFFYGPSERTHIEDDQSFIVACLQSLFLVCISAPNF